MNGNEEVYNNFLFFLITANIEVGVGRCPPAACAEANRRCKPVAKVGMR